MFNDNPRTPVFNLEPQLYNVYSTANECFLNKSSAALFGSEIRPIKTDVNIPHVEVDEVKSDDSKAFDNLGIKLDLIPPNTRSVRASTRARVNVAKVVKSRNANPKKRKSRKTKTTRTQRKRSRKAKPKK